MKSVLEEVSLGFDEHMTEETTEVLPELADVEHLHLKGHLWYPRADVTHWVGIAKSPQPFGHERCPYHDFVSQDRWDKVVEEGVTPLNKGEASFFSGLGVSISLLSDVIFQAKVIAEAMEQQITNLE